MSARIEAKARLDNYECDRFSVSASLLLETFEYLPEDVKRRLSADAHAIPTGFCWGAHDCEIALDQWHVTDEDLRRGIISESLRRVEMMEFGIATPFAETLKDVAQECGVTVTDDADDD